MGLVGRSVSKRKALVVLLLATATAIAGFVAWMYLESAGPAPKWVIQVDGDFVRDMEFSPDGRSCAVCTRETKFDANGQEAIRVYDLVKAHLVFEARDQGSRCSWNRSGTCLATTATDRGRVSLWDPQTWKRLHELKLDRPRPPAMFETNGICFDKADNLYTSGIARLQDIIPGGVFQPLVWWNPIAHPNELPSVIGTRNTWPFSLSAGGDSTKTRVAVSYEDSRSAHGSIIEVFEITNALDGPGRIQKAFVVEENVGKGGVCWVQLSGDGNTLAVLGTTGLWVLQVFSDHATVVLKRLRGKERAFVHFSLKFLDLPYDGRFVAYTWPEPDSATEVLRVGNGQTVLHVRRGGGATIAISADGRLLALSDQRSASVCFYEVPQ